MLFCTAKLGHLVVDGETITTKHMEPNKEFAFDVNRVKNWVVTPSLLNTSGSLSEEKTKLKLKFERRGVAGLEHSEEGSAYTQRTEEILRRTHDFEVTKNALANLRKAVDEGEYDDIPESELDTEISQLVGIMATHSRRIEQLDTGVYVENVSQHVTEREFTLVLCHGVSYSIGSLFFEATEAEENDLCLQWQRPVLLKSTKTYGSNNSPKTNLLILPLREQLEAEVDNNRCFANISSLGMTDMSIATLKNNPGVLFAAGGITTTTTNDNNDRNHNLYRLGCGGSWTQLKPAPDPPGKNPILLSNNFQTTTFKLTI